MSGVDRSVATVADVEKWHPSYWTLVCVATFHLFLAATLLTAIPTPTPPRPINVVDVVTFPDGVSTPVTPELDSKPVELRQTRPQDEMPLPKVEVNPKLGPKLGPRPTDRRPMPIPEAKILPTPSVAEPEAAPMPPPPIEPKPIEPKPIEPAPKAAIKPAVPSPTPRPASIPAPSTPAVQAATPLPVNPAAASASLVQPDAAPLNLKSAKLKLKQVTALKQTSPLELKAPPVETLPMAAPIKSANPVTPLTPVPIRPSPAAQPSAPIAPAVAQTKAAPLAIPTARVLLPKVQVPRIAAVDLRLPEVQVAAPSPSTPATGSPTSGKPAGVTSVASSTSAAPRAQGGPGGALPPTAASSGGGAPAGGGGSPAAGSLPRGNNAGSSGPAGLPGSTGVLPRRPGGASVRQEFPRGDDSTVLGRMDKTYDCSRLNRDRDARCPNWDPIEGRNSQGAAGFEVPVPKGLPKLRNPIGTNPLPTCPPGTPGNQMGLSCLPTREGPGIPRQ